MFAAPQFLLLDGGHGVHDARMQPVPNRFVEDAHTAARDGPEGDLALSGNAELAHDEHVERRAKRLGDLVGDRDPSARKAKHERVGPAGEVAQGAGQAATGLGTVPECTRHRYEAPLTTRSPRRCPLPG